MPVIQELMNTREVAASLRVDTSTVARMAKSGRLVPAAKGPGIRGCLFFARADVERVAKAAAS